MSASNAASPVLAVMINPITSFSESRLLNTSRAPRKFRFRESEKLRARWNKRKSVHRRDPLSSDSDVLLALKAISCAFLVFSTDVLLTCVLQVDVILRLVDTGGHEAYQFLKSLILRDRSVVLVCFEGRRERDAVETVRNNLDTLSTLMDGGVVLLVATQLDEMKVTPDQLLAVQGDLDALCETNSEVRSLRQLWRDEIAPLCSRYQKSLHIDSRFLAVSCVEGFDLTLDLLRSRMREGVQGVRAAFMPPSLCMWSFLLTCALSSSFLFFQMEDAHQLYRSAYLELPRELLRLQKEEEVRFLPTEKVHQVALSCGFMKYDWQSGLRVMEQVFPQLSTPLPSFPQVGCSSLQSFHGLCVCARVRVCSYGNALSFAVDDHVLPS